MVFCFDKHHTRMSMKINGSKGQCCGCSVCTKFCPTGAISMITDSEGFEYPVIDKEKCIDCGACMQACAFRQKKSIVEPLEYWGVKCISEETRMKSRSGGMFATCVEYLMKVKNAKVYGAAYDENLTVRHIRITEQKDIIRLQNSKYVQSKIGECFNMAMMDLQNGESVVFSGTPCQIDALNQFLKLKNVDPQRLITFDVVCHGTPSPLIYKEYLKWIEDKYGREIREFNFRDKEKGWRPHIESFVLDDNEKKYEDIYTDLFYQHVMFRPSCHNCPYASLDRVGDITIADFWKIEKGKLSDFEDEKGVSLVLVNSIKGKELLKAVEMNLICKETTKAECLQPNLEGPSTKGDNREDFWSTYLEYGINEVIAKFVLNKRGIPYKKTVVFPANTRLGILTYHYAHNYGAVLQAWALLSVLSKWGIYAECIPYKSKRIAHGYLWNPWQLRPTLPQSEKEKLGLIKRYKRKKEIRCWNKDALEKWHNRHDKFETFINRKLCIGKYKFCVKRLDAYEAIICGSDQIWGMNQPDPIYFGAFPTDSKKIAYSVSMGNTEVNQEKKMDVTKWIRDFKCVSVREESMSGYIKNELGLSEPQVTLDPTLLLRAEDYDLIMQEVDNPEAISKPYVYVYCVLDDEEMVQMARELAEKLHYSLVINRMFYWKGNSDIQDCEAGPIEFLKRIHEADIVITNSFHGTCFSVLFHKPFWSVYREGKNIRIKELLEMLNLERRHLEPGCQVTDTLEIPWEEVDDILEEKRRESKKFLKEALTS